MQKMFLCRVGQGREKPKGRRSGAECVAVLRKVYESYDNSTNITSDFGQAIYRMQPQEFTKLYESSQSFTNSDSFLSGIQRLEILPKIC